ncbi:mammalian ependymin-related protein 1-like isoform X2 [Haliotis rubra]|uniref:mammalian ependymin-related protein 1-like isoform X2 n=1 Tax=Haliotis rubra TaxID=36100 RepID=UPI001EE5934E|nr:mammalian ependymin-related protein 1-like isoform X2 [Haliotis rubra]
MVSRLALICTLAVVLYHPRALAQLRTAKNCCFPKQWEGFQGGIGGVNAGGQGQAVQIVTKIAFDAVGRRVFTYTNSTTAAGMSSTKLIRDFNTNTMYVIDVLKRICQKTKPTALFNNGCVPDAAKQVFDMTIGAGSETLQAKIYTMRLQQASTLLNITLSVTEKQCVPVGEYWVGSVNNVKTVMSMQYFDITLGIKDPSVFTPPAFCKQNITGDAAFHPVLNYRILNL